MLLTFLTNSILDIFIIIFIIYLLTSSFFKRSFHFTRLLFSNLFSLILTSLILLTPLNKLYLDSLTSALSSIGLNVVSNLLINFFGLSLTNLTLTRVLIFILIYLIINIFISLIMVIYHKVKLHEIGLEKYKVTYNLIISLICIVISLAFVSLFALELTTNNSIILNNISKMFDSFSLLDGFKESIKTYLVR